jgi:hypothetical protein
MGRRHRRVHELHHIEVALLGLHTDMNEVMSVLSTASDGVGN